MLYVYFFFFFQAEDGIRDIGVTGVQTCALPIYKLEYHFTIHEMPLDERPRERLRHYGPEALATAELIAIILRTGTTRDNAVEMSAKLLAKYGGFTGVVRGGCCGGGQFERWGGGEDA